MIRVIDRRLGLVAAMETFCTGCNTVVNSTLSSDRIEGSTSGNMPFFTVRQAIVGSIDMGVGHSGLVKLCRLLDMAPVHHKTFARHSRAICDANKMVVTGLFDDAERVVRRVYHDLDPPIGINDIIDLTVSFDGSWMTQGHKALAV